MSIRWTKATMMEAAEGLLTVSERALLTSLLEDVEARGGRFSWGNGSTAGVTGWYRIGDKDTPVWNVNVGGAAGRARLNLIFGEYASRHDDSERPQKYAEAAQAVPSLSARVKDVQAAAYKGWAGTSLALAAEAKEQVLAAVAVAKG